MELDPGVELLGDAPIAAAKDDLLDRARVAQRLVELATAQPVVQPRVIGLLGAAGSGKTSVVNLALEVLSAHAEVTTVVIDAASYPSAVHLTEVITAELTKVFTAAGVVGSGEKVRNAFSNYAGVVSGVVKAAIKVDVSDALKRSPASLRAEILENTKGAARRIAILIDHVDRVPASELAPTLDAIAFYGEIPYVALVIALDGRARQAPGAAASFARLVQVELALPPADRTLLARVLAGGLARLAERTGRDLDAALPLFDPDGGAALALVATPRDAKRAANALAAMLPLVPDAEVADAALAAVLHVTAPELDWSLLAARAELDEEARIGLCRQLAPPLTGTRAVAIARAVRTLLMGES